MKVFNKRSPDYSQYDLQAEKDNLRKFLDENDLWIPESFYNNIRVGDVIDVYNNPPDISQIYANKQFKALCSYSEEQMKDVPFPKLFYRSDDVQLALIKQMTDVALNKDDAVPWNLKDHELVETLHPNKRTFEINMGWVAPCFKKGTNERVAFASSLKVGLIFEWG
ncbi:hypothetical protein [Pseudobdellovibrio exovorus]|uniref:Uncharacterized protein n=1 Tax=Pseudobdellovibrio exovorus JSS TaxID=1184267 RepID=M4V9Z0_9BACT|nr:hypothetical protein [Pseudobdellovibrio exovorus]AGH96008.1 hypothetical protein A11Q_1792 [Pseudobdellovibrio exovorus JSS]